MKALSLVQNFVFERPLWQLILTIALLIFIKVGIWYIPNIEMSLAIAQNPFINPFEDPRDHYLLGNWASNYLAYLFHATKWLSFFLYYLAFSLGFSFLFLGFVLRHLEGDSIRKSLILFCILPVSATAYFWVGPDSVTLFFLLLPFVFPVSLVITILCGLILGLQHFEQSAIGVGALCLALYINGRSKQPLALTYKLRFALTLLAGIGLGKFALNTFFSLYQIQVNSGRWYVLIQNLFHGGFDLLGNFFLNWQTIIWGMLGLGWVVVFRLMDLGSGTKSFFIALGCLVLLIPLVGDQTRVGAITTLPLLLVFCLSNPTFLNKLSKRFVAGLFGLWVLMPWAWVFLGKARNSVSGYDFMYLTHRLWGWFSVPHNADYWPFF